MATYYDINGNPVEGGTQADGTNIGVLGMSGVIRAYDPTLKTFVGEQYYRTTKDAATALRSKQVGKEWAAANPQAAALMSMGPPSVQQPVQQQVAQQPVQQQVAPDLGAAGNAQNLGIAANTPLTWVYQYQAPQAQQVEQRKYAGPYGQSGGLLSGFDYFINPSLIG